MPPVPFILCADDFGFTRGVSKGILDLAAKRRISAVSCMMTQREIRDSAKDLKSHTNHLDIGIHLVLTDVQPLSLGLDRLPAIGHLTKTALIGRLPTSNIRKELKRQFEVFTEMFGRQPDFIDGHHHVHQLPGIRDIVLDLIEELFDSHPPYVRSCSERPSLLIRRGVAPFKSAAISVFGVGLKRKAAGRNVPFNTGFSGVYDLSGKIPYEKLFDRFTEGLRPGALIMCHPGKVDSDLKSLDSLTYQREVELAYFLSDKFTVLLERKNLCLGRFPTRAK
jgi:predicted glycoside hydrolase/deacetylase ChbG (UPF0249 family)